MDLGTVLSKLKSGAYTSLGKMQQQYLLLLCFSQSVKACPHVAGCAIFAVSRTLCMTLRHTAHQVSMYDIATVFRELSHAFHNIWGVSHVQGSMESDMSLPALEVFTLLHGIA